MADAQPKRSAISSTVFAFSETFLAADKRFYHERAGKKKSVIILDFMGKCN